MNCSTIALLISRNFSWSAFSTVGKISLTKVGRFLLMESLTNFTGKEEILFRWWVFVFLGEVLRSALSPLNSLSNRTLPGPTWVSRVTFV